METRYVRIGEVRFDPGAPASGQILSEAHTNRTRPVCCCKPNAPELYIAKVGEQFYVKRLPGTGYLHAPNCPSYEPPEGLSGMAEVRRAVRVDEIDDTTHLKLAFPLTQAGKRMAPPPSSGSPQTEVNDKPGKLSLIALLQWLWNEAGLTTWVPAMAGKRNWYIIRREILTAARQMEAKGHRLAERLFIPEPFSMDHKDAIAERRGAFLNRLAPVPDQPRPLLVMIAPLKSHTPTAYGGKLVFTHLPDLPVFVSGEMYKRICEKFAERILLADQIEGGRAILAGAIGYSDSGILVMHEAAMMVVTPEWLPVEHSRDAQVIETLVSQKRRFVRQLRFTLKPEAPIATAVLTDTEDPYAVFCTPPSDVADSFGRYERAIDESAYSTWLWDTLTNPPKLPDVWRAS